MRTVPIVMRRMNVVVKLLLQSWLVAICPAIFQRNDPKPKNNSVHTASARMHELMTHDHPDVWRANVKMNKPTFMGLCQFLREKTGIRDKRETTVEEYLLLFIRHGLCGEDNRIT